MASIRKIIAHKVPKYEEERRKHYLEYLKAQNDRESTLSYNEWKRQCRIHGPNKNPQLFSLPSIKLYNTDGTPELPRC